MIIGLFELDVLPGMKTKYTGISSQITSTEIFCVKTTYFNHVCFVKRSRNNRDDPTRFQYRLELLKLVGDTKEFD